VVDPTPAVTFLALIGPQKVLLSFARIAPIALMEGIGGLIAYWAVIGHLTGKIIILMTICQHIE
jgi:hypothetical protein